MKIWIYRRSEANSELDKIIKKIPSSLSDGCTIFTDAERGQIAFDSMKREMEDSSGILVLIHLDDLGPTRGAVASEIRWLKAHNIFLVADDYPSTWKSLDADVSGIIEEVLADVMEHDADTITQFRIDVSKGGRPQTVYPEKWNLMYQKWKDGKTTAAQFMKQSGLKKGTFYHMVSDYAATMQNMKEERKLG